MGEERAEIYLRRLAEAELRRVGGELRGLDAGALDAGALDAGGGTGAGSGSDPGRAPVDAAEGAVRKVIRAGQILIVAGVLDQDYVGRVAGELRTALNFRSRLLLKRSMLHRTLYEPPGSPLPAAGPASQAMRVTPIGQTLRVASERAPSALHLMSLVQTGTKAVITVAMRMHWPPDGSSTDLEITGAGPHHLPYSQLGAGDDRGARYAVRFERGHGGTATWRGIVTLSPVPPPSVRRLDLVGDGARLVRLPLGPLAADRHEPAEPVVIPPGERLLVLAAERILASGDTRGPGQGPDLGEMITVLTEAGAIAADSPVPGQIAALCQRLGAAGPGIAVSPAAEIPAQWASVIAQRDTPVPADGPEVFAPLAGILPDVYGARFALAGLSSVAGESHLHVVGSGVPELTGRFARNWTPGFSWWLRDDAGNWHVATADEPDTFGNGLRAFRLRLTPPLAAVPDTVEVVVTGPATRVRATVPVIRG